jgi:hypothetical protein
LNYFFRLMMILLSLMPSRKDGHGICILDIKLFQLFDDAHRAQYAVPLISRG